MRRPRGRSRSEFGSDLDKALKQLRARVHPEITESKKRWIGTPFAATGDRELVKRLLEIYRQQTGDTRALTRSIRGGTYARLFEGAVDFGPSLPGARYTGHSPDEYISVALLGQLTRMLTDAIESLDALATERSVTPPQ